MACWRSFLRVAGLLVGLVGCSSPAEDGKETGEGEDDTGGGGSGTLWRPAGEGTAYFVDGAEDNSLFHLELTRVIEPRDGEAYYGWVSKGGADPIALGEIPVTAEEVSFDADIGVNALIEGYDTFEAWATDNGGTALEGEKLWEGAVNPVVYGVIQTLLISSTDTPDGQGSLRALETAVQVVEARGQALIDAEFDLDTFNAESEAIANSLEGTEEDRNDDGRIDTIDGQLGILNEGGYVDLILADLREASDQVTPGDPIKDYANYAYDCSQSIEEHVHYASIDADVGSICVAEKSCDARMADVVVELGYALDGEDEDENGVIDDLANPTEGTIECAITYISQMAQMAVATP